MTWSEENPKRVQRIKQLSVQAAVLLHEIDKKDKTLANKRAIVKTLLPDVLKRAKANSASELLTKAVQSAKGEDKTGLEQLIETHKLDENALEFMAVLVGLFGLGPATNQLDMKAQMRWKDLWGITKTAALENISSVLGITRNPKGFKPQRPLNEPIFVLSEPPKGLGKAQLEYLKLTREQIDITAGTRFPEFAGSSVLGIAAGHGIDELDKWAHEEGIDSPETELAICRQNGKFVAGQLQTMHDLVETMEGIALIQQVQDSMPRNSPQWRQVDAAIKTQRIQLATESASMLKRCTWENINEALSTQDTKDMVKSENEAWEDEPAEK